MKILLVPWSKSCGFALRIYEQPYSGYTDDPEPIEIATSKGHEIATALLDAYPKRLCSFNPQHSVRIAVEVDAPEEVGARLLKVLESLANVNPKVLRGKTAKGLTGILLENPTLEGVEHLLAITKLLEE